MARRRVLAQKVLAVGLGNMGMSHALAYARIPGFELVGVCERRIADAQAAGSARGNGEVRELRGSACTARA